MKILYENENGGVAIVNPTEEVLAYTTIDVIAKKAVNGFFVRNVSSAFACLVDGRLSSSSSMKVPLLLFSFWNSLVESCLGKILLWVGLLSEQQYTTTRMLFCQ